MGTTRNLCIRESHGGSCTIPNVAANLLFPLYLSMDEGVEQPGFQPVPTWMLAPQPLAKPTMPERRLLVINIKNTMGIFQF